MAQLVARLVRIEEVRGSNPLRSTQCDESGHVSQMSREILDYAAAHDRVVVSQDSDFTVLLAQWRATRPPSY